MNAISGEDAAIVTEIPGTTRDILNVEVSVRGFPIKTLFATEIPFGAINFVLSGSKSPIEFRNGPVEYTVAMIDVQKEHRVTASNGKRILFKLSIFDIDYDTACKRYDKYQKDKLLEFGT